MLPALLTLASANAAPTLVKDVTVVSQKGATPAELHAAQELRDHLEKVTGATVRLAKDADRAPASAIIVGPGPLAKSLFKEVNLDSFDQEELVMRTKGSRLLLAGGRPRGTLYAVYRFLHEEAGVRWWTPWATQLPKNPHLAIRTLDRREKPAFESRDPFWFHAFDADWAVRNGSNGAMTRIDETRGGKLVYGGFVHTFYPLVPPQEHFAKHPEWYSMLKGKRTVEGGQLCTTNPELRDFVVEQVQKMLREKPDVRIVSVSQNDWYGACECDVCKALDESEGTQAASVLALANYVGEKIEKEFPLVAVDTLAYQYTRKAPKTMKPRPNVIVRLCSIECNFAQPLEHASNETFARDLRDWSRLTDRLYIWDYTTDFPNYVQPFPNYFVLGPNLRFFHKNGVRGVFEQGAYQSFGAEMAEMRAWVLAQLLWNPEQDDKKLIDEFLAGYYGAAAKPIRAYLELMADAAKDTNMLIWVGSDAPFFTLDTMLAAERLWEEAAASVASDPELSWRIRQARLAPHYVWLNRWQAFQEEANRRSIGWPMTRNKTELAQAWLKEATSPGPAGWAPITHLSESGTTPQKWVEAVSK